MRGFSSTTSMDSCTIGIEVDGADTKIRGHGMYLAELHGKLSSKIERMEDVLTSNVFSFFKYSDREVFLKGYLAGLGFGVSEQEAKDAEFLFWQRFEDNTEPDLVIKVGRYYLLFEAKYFSGFAEGNEVTKAQLLREIEGGKLEADGSAREFNLIAITADPYYKDLKFGVIPSDLRPTFQWTNWQSVALFIQGILESNKNLRGEAIAFATDLYRLLDKKNLRGFHGWTSPLMTNVSLRSSPSVFFEARTARFRGSFLGFPESLWSEEKMTARSKTVFLSSQRQMLTSLLQLGRMENVEGAVFFEGASQS